MAAGKLLGSCMSAVNLLCFTRQCGRGAEDDGRRGTRDGSVMFVLIRSQHKFGIGGSEPAEIFGRQGERWFDEADADMPARLALGWEDSGYYFSLSGTLAGPLDEETVEKIAYSVRVE